MDLEELGSIDPLIVLGVDPGSHVTGFGVVGRRLGALCHVDHGVFRVNRALPVSERLLAVHTALCALIRHHRPHVMSLEEAFVQHNVQSALRLGEVRGAALLAAATLDLPVIQYPTAVAKKSVCGHGGATKERVQAMVQHQLDLKDTPKPHDAADGLALALCLLFDPKLDPCVAKALRG